MARQEKGWVYFVQAPINGLIKIGHTEYHPDRRLISLRVGSPVPLEPLGVLRAGFQMEQMLHQRFHETCHHNEWFEPTEDLLAFIREEALPWPEASEEFVDYDQEVFKRRRAKAWQRFMDDAVCIARARKLIS